MESFLLAARNLVTNKMRIALIPVGTGRTGWG